MNNDIVLVGGGKHAGDIYDMFAREFDIIGLIDDVYDNPNTTQLYGLKCLGKSNDIDNIIRKDMQIFLAIGSEGDMRPRQHYIKMFNEKKLKSPILIYQNSYISNYSSIGDGTMVGYGTRIGPQVQIGKHCVIGHNVSIEHDCKIGDNVFIASGVTLAGNVIVGSNTFIGVGAVSIQKITIGSFCTIGAGSCIIRNVSDHDKVIGNPGRVLNQEIK